MKADERSMLDALLNVEEGLSDFAIRFIDSIDQQDRAKDGALRLTPRQRDFLERLHRDHA